LTEDVDLGEIERRAVAAYHEDGLMDVFMGGYLLFIGLSIFIEPDYRPFLFSFVPPLGVVLYNYVKKRVTYPRLGYVGFTKERRARVARDTIVVLVVAGLVTLTGLFTGMGAPESASWWVLLLNRYNLLFQGGVLALIFLALGRIMSVNRLYWYSVISLLVFSAGYLYLGSPFIVSPQNLSVPCATIGVMMAGVGASHLRRFIEKYPREA